MATNGLTQAQTMKAIADHLGIPKATVQEVFETLADIVIQVCAKQQNVATPLGIFKGKIQAAKPARTGKNPFDPDGPTKRFPAVPAKRVVRLTVRKAIKDAIAKKKK